MILAVALSLVVLIGWSWVSNRYFPTANPPSTKVENGRQKPVPQPQAQPVPATPKATQSRSAVLGSTPRVRIETPSLQGSLVLKGAQIDDLVLVRHRRTIAKDSPPVRLLSPLGAPGAYVASFGWIAEGTAAPGLNAVWTADGAVLSPGHPVTLSTQSADGVRYEMKVAIDGGYLFTVEQRAINASGKPIVVRPIGLVSRANKSPDPDAWTNHVGPIGVFDGKADYDVNWKDLDQGKTETYAGVPGWLGFTDHFWLTALVPPGQMTGEFRRSPSGGYQADYVLAPASIAPGQALTTNARLFAGAKEKEWLDRYEDAGIPKLTKSIDWGWFEWFMRPIFDLLMFLFGAIGNFGVAIICLTLIVRGIMFPIAQKQFQSMAAMRKIQPKMKAIQEKYKDDRARQQQEILRLYQEEKINPAAGCLPILLQIPGFYALYPLLLGITMWLQFKLNPQQMDPTQQQVFALMPWVMMFIMAPFASGLMVYWVTSNLLTILQQWWLYRRFGLHLSDTHPVHT